MHGAALNFLAWGVLHGLYQIIANLTRGLRKKMYESLHIPENAWPARLFKLLCTFALVDFAWIFFRANGLGEVFVLLRALFNPTGYASQYWNLLQLGLSARDIVIALCAIGILFFTSLLQRKPGALLRFERIVLPVRWAVYLCGVFIVLAFGYYGPLAAPSVFVYFQF